MTGSRTSGIPPVDPEAPQTPFQRVMRTVGKTKPGMALAKAVPVHVDAWLLEHTNGWIATSIGFPRLNMTTTGRKSGEPRTTTLLYFTRGDDVVVIASCFGSDKHPAWYLNVAADPHVELLCRGYRGRYVAREADEPERSELYALARKLYGAYTLYAARTDRRIPVMVLSPE